MISKQLRALAICAATCMLFSLSLAVLASWKTTPVSAQSNPDTGQWSSISFKEKEFKLAGSEVVVHEQYIYIIGGKDGKQETAVPSAQVFMLNTADENNLILQTRASLLEPLFGHAAVKVVDINNSAYIYVIGGWDGSIRRRETWRSKILVETGELEQWEEVREMDMSKLEYPFGVDFHEAVFVKDKIYVIGGSKAGNKKDEVLSTNLVYSLETARTFSDTNLITWTQESSLFTPLHRHSATVYGSTIYVTGGFDGSSLRENIAFYDLENSGGWQISDAKLKEPTDYHASYTSDNRLYILGGRTQVDGGSDNLIFSSDVYSFGLNDECEPQPPLQQHMGLNENRYRYGLAVQSWLGGTENWATDPEREIACLKDSPLTYDVPIAKRLYLIDGISNAGGKSNYLNSVSSLNLIGPTGVKSIGIWSDKYGPVTPGEQITYTIQAVNGGGELRNSRLEILVPRNIALPKSPTLEFQYTIQEPTQSLSQTSVLTTTTATVNQSTGTINWPVANIPEGAEINASYTVTYEGSLSLSLSAPTASRRVDEIPYELKLTNNTAQDKTVIFQSFFDDKYCIFENPSELLIPRICKDNEDQKSKKYNSSKITVTSGSLVTMTFYLLDTTTLNTKTEVVLERFCLVSDTDNTMMNCDEEIVLLSSLDYGDDGAIVTKIVDSADEINPAVKTIDIRDVISATATISWGENESMAATAKFTNPVPPFPDIYIPLMFK